MLSTLRGGSRKDIEDSFKKIGGKRKSVDEDKWTNNSRKLKRLSGKQYVTKSGVEVPGKIFKPVSKCCMKNCFKSVSPKDQQATFDMFYNERCKATQDAIIRSMVLNECLGRRRVSDPKKHRLNTWTYAFKVDGKFVEVCRSFILCVMQISEKRLRVVQQKVLSGSGFEEKRGSHTNRPHKLSENVWELALEHLKSIPHKTSHYAIKKSNRLYFENPNLNIKDIYTSFCEYFEEKTGETLKMAYKTYFKFYRSTNFTVAPAKTDVCDYCTECQKKLDVNPQDQCLLWYNVHKKM